MALVPYGPVFAELLSEPRLMPLGPGSPNTAARSILEEATVETAFAHARIRDRDMPSCCLAGVWLYHDFLDESHRISQDIDTASGSYWHGIMHRREPDYGNSKYWFRRVGSHPVFVPLREAAAKLAGGVSDHAAGFLKRQTSWDPSAFIDLVEASDGGLDACATLCQQIQQREWELLFEYCYRESLKGE